MEIADLITRLRRSWMIWLLVIVVGIGAAVASTSREKRSYSASSILQVYPNGGNSGVSVQAVQLLLPGLVAKVDGPTFANLVSKSPSWNTVPPSDAKLSASGDTTTGLLTITAKGSDPNAVALASNAYAQYLVQHQATQAQFSNVSLVQAAVQPVHPAGTSRRAILLASALLAVIVGALLALAFDAWRGQRRDPVRYRKLFGAEVLATIPKVTRRHRSRLMPPALFGGNRRSDVLEAFQSLQVSVGLLVRDHPGLCIAVSSVDPGDGRSTVAANLAWALARSGLRVTLIDADMRNPSQVELLGLDDVSQTALPAVPGQDVSSWDLPHATDDERDSGFGDRGMGLPVQVSPQHQLHLVVCDDPDLHPAEVISSRFPELLRRAALRSDVVIVDAPSLQASSETMGVLVPTRTAVLVVDSAHTDPARIRRWTRELQRLDVAILGLVINRASGRIQGVPAYSPYSPHRDAAFLGTDHVDGREADGVRAPSEPGQISHSALTAVTEERTVAS